MDNSNSGLALVKYNNDAPSSADSDVLRGEGGVVLCGTSDTQVFNVQPGMVDPRRHRCVLPAGHALPHIASRWDGTEFAETAEEFGGHVNKEPGIDTQ